MVLTTYDADEWVFDAIRSGASGYLLKDTAPEDLITAVRGTVEGKTHVDPDVAGKLFQHVTITESTTPSFANSDTLTKLSEREIEILQLMAKGFNNRQIAEQIFLSEGTIRNYVSSILSKLDVTDRTQAVLIAIRRGYIA